MQNEAHPDLINAWKNQSVEPARISLADLRSKAGKLRQQVLRRNLMEYAAGALVIACFAYYVWLFPVMLARMGCGFIIAATLFVMYTLHRRGAASAMAENPGMSACIDFHRRELERQRDLLTGVWSWYLLPFVPGLICFHLGLFQFAMQKPGAQEHVVRAVFGIGLSFLLCALVFVAIGSLNMWAARKLQDEIDALDALQDNALQDKRDRKPADEGVC